MLDMPFDYDERLVSRAIRRADVVSVFFPWFGKALILDMRFDGDTPPAVFADDMAGSTDERLLMLARQRPRLGRARRLTAVPWPAGIGSFVAAGLHDHIVERVRRLGFPDLVDDCERALADLSAAEREMKLAYVRGMHCRTVYPR